MICRGVLRIQMCDSPRILQNENRGTQGRRYLVNGSVGPLPVPIQYTAIGCVQEVLCDTVKEVVAWRSSELRCPGSTVGSVYGEKDNGDANPNGGDHIRIPAEVVRVKKRQHVNPHGMLRKVGGG